MPTLSVGATSRGPKGVTLAELLIAVTIIALLAGLAYPSVSAGVDSLRLRSASDQVLGFFSAALDLAGRRQQVVEVQVLPEENALLARTADPSFFRRLEIPKPARIAAVTPPLAAAVQPNQARRFLLYPGGAIPAIGVELETPQGRRRLVRLDPLTATARAENVSP